MDFDSQKTPVTIRQAFEKSANIMARASGTVGQQCGVNVSSILDNLIRECGRWTERYASDMLITWKAVEAIIDGTDCPPGTNRIFVFAVRRDGVDGVQFFMSRSAQHINKHNPYLDLSMYRRIMALQVSSDDGHYCNLVLKDIEHELLRLAPEDADPTPEA